MQHKLKNCALIYLVLAALCIVGIPRGRALAQTKPAGTAKSSLCTRDNALEMVKQQVSLTKTFNDPLRRIAVLIRAGDLLWPHEQKMARAVFTEAFELAIETEKVNDEKGPRSIILRLQVADQRYIVIRAVAKRDSAWAKELTQQMLKLDTQDTQAASTKDSFKELLTAEKLLYAAYQTVRTDTVAALDLARAGFNYPATSFLTHFLYRYAEINQQAADQFYAQALSVYADRPMREFLYLQAYPFGLRESRNTPVFAFYQVPPKFVPNRSLQRQLVQIMLRRAEQILETPADQLDTYRNPNAMLMPAPVNLLQALVLIEPQVRTSLPDLHAPLTQAREKILVSLSAETQKLLLQPGREIATAPEKTFDEQLEAAENLTDVSERDSRISAAVFGSEKENLADVIQAIDKLGDSNVRAHFLEWLYFHRALAAIESKQFDLAERLTSKVEGAQQRAYLHVEIAKGLLKGTETQTHAWEVLDEAITEAGKAGATIFAARVLLTASNLYTKIDATRSISLLTDAVTSINRLESPDFFSDGQAQEKLIPRGRGRGHYNFRFYMPGLDPESAFREMAKIDFDTSISQSSALTDKLQRALSTLGIAYVCLQQARPQKSTKGTNGEVGLRSPW